MFIKDEAYTFTTTISKKHFTIGQQYSYKIISPDKSIGVLTSISFNTTPLTATENGVSTSVTVTPGQKGLYKILFYKGIDASSDTDEGDDTLIGEYYFNVVESITNPTISIN